MMMNPLLGTIMPWSGSFVPEGWALCDGRLLKVAENPALYSLIGIAYGGDGMINFALPDLRACVPIGSGETSLGKLPLGRTFGTPSSLIKIDQNTMPAHTHRLVEITVEVQKQSANLTWQVSQELGERSKPKTNDYLGGIPDIGDREMHLYRDKNGTRVKLSGLHGTINAQNVEISAEVGDTGFGEGIEINNIQPVLGLNFIIACKGEFPQRPKA